MLKSIGDALQAFGPLGIFAFALLDSLGVPLVGGVDLVLLYFSAKTPQMAYFGAATATVGSLVGNLLLFRGARYGIRRFRREEVPDGKRQRFRLWFQRYGLLTVFIPALTPFVPLPLKVFVISAGALHTPLSSFLAVVLLARIIRYFGEAYLGMRLGQDASGYLTQNAWNILGVAVAVVLVLIGVIKWYDRRRAEV